MNIKAAVIEDLQHGPYIAIKHPSSVVKVFSRKPIFKADGVYIRLFRAEYKIKDFSVQKHGDFDLTIFEVE